MYGIVLMRGERLMVQAGSSLAKHAKERLYPSKAA